MARNVVEKSDGRFNVHGFDLLKAAMNAPSARDLRPWHFIVMREREKMDRVPSFHAYSQMMREATVAVLICGVSITVGVFYPVRLNPTVWKLLLSGYVLIAAGVPVWILLQSRDFINVHILYVGMVALVVTLVVAGLRGAGVTDLNPQAVAIPKFNIEEGTQALGFFWPGLFIVIACGAVSGFHSLCAGGTTCKQITTEKAARQIGYYGMLLESFLAVCVIGVLMIGAAKADYIRDVHPVKLLGLA